MHTHILKIYVCGRQKKRGIIFPIAKDNHYDIVMYFLLVFSMHI